MTIDDLEDVDTLRRAAKLLEAENQKMARVIVKLQRQLHDLKGGDPEQLALQIAGLEDQLSALRRRMFGESSEKRPKSGAGSSSSDKPKKQTGHGRRPQQQLELVEEEHVVGDADKVCTNCGGELSVWSGQYEESEEIDVLERRFVLKKHKRQKYRCGCGQCIETAPGPVKLFDGARYSVNFAVHVAMGKYADHLPLERQVRMMQRDGLEIDSQTLWDQLNALGQLLKPAHERLHGYVLSQPVIGVDETHWRLMGEKGKKQGGAGKRWQAWAVVAPEAVCYRILDSRSAEAAGEVLRDYSGTILCDGYGAYASLKKKGGRFRVAHCWAHVRRKFVELEEQHPEAVKEVLGLIGELYHIERAAKTGPPEELLAIRRERSRPIVRRIHNWALGTRVLPQSALGKAIGYMGSVWDGLQVFLDDPHVELDNNRTERALRGVVIGRKNHYGSRSRRGTEVAALLYSLIESTKLAGVGPHTYLRAAVNAALRRGQIPLPHEMA